MTATDAQYIRICVGYRIVPVFAIYNAGWTNGCADSVFVARFLIDGKQFQSTLLSIMQKT
jgi:hypothetical protein